MVQCTGFGIRQPGEAKVAPITFERANPKSNEVSIDVLFCGICHSDLENLDDNWGFTKYPCIPGHEAVGKVREIGSEVTQFQVGELVGVGCMVDSCQRCLPCSEGWENHCEGPNGPTMAYNGYLSPTTADAKAYNNFGAWADNVVVREEFVIGIPQEGDLSKIAPLMCPGTATFGPITRFGISADSRIGVIGLGGPGHLAVQMIKAFGASHITVFTTHEAKRDAALRLGADEVIVSTDDIAMQKGKNSLHHILSTIPVPFDPAPYLACLTRRGTMTVMGLLGPYKKIMNNFELAQRGLSLTGSMIGSVAETRGCVDFCLKHGILPEVEMVSKDSINAALERLRVADVRFRFVIDMRS